MQGKNYQAARKGLVYQEYVTLWKLLEVYHQGQKFALEAETIEEGILDDLVLVNYENQSKECYQIKSSQDENKSFSLSDLLSDAKKNNIQIEKLFDSWYQARSNSQGFTCKAILFTCNNLSQDIVNTTFEAYPSTNDNRCRRFNKKSREKLIQKIKAKSQSLPYCEDEDNIIDEFFKNFFIYYNQPRENELEQKIITLLENLPDIRLSTQPMLDALRQFMRSYVSNNPDKSFVLDRIKVNEILTKAKFSSETFVEIQTKSTSYYESLTKDFIGNHQTIQRTSLLEEMTSILTEDHCLLTGDHGVGKSAIIKQYVKNRKDYLVFDLSNLNLKVFSLDSKVALSEIIDYVAKHIKLIIIENSEQLAHHPKFKTIIQFINAISNTNNTIKFLFASTDEKSTEEILEKNKSINFKKMKVSYFNIEEISQYFPNMVPIIQRLPNNAMYTRPLILDIIIRKKMAHGKNFREDMSIDEFITVSLGYGEIKTNSYHERKKILCDLVLQKELEDTAELKALISEGIIHRTMFGEYDAHMLYKEWAMSRILKSFYKLYTERSFQSDFNNFLNTIVNFSEKWPYHTRRWLKDNQVITKSMMHITVSSLTEKAKEYLLNCFNQDKTLVYSVIDCRKKDIIDLIITFTKKKGLPQFALLHAAITKGNVEMARYIIERADGFYLHDGFIDDKDGAFGCADICTINHAIQANQNEILASILEAEKKHYDEDDSDINVKDELGRSLQVALESSNHEAVEILLKDKRLDLSKQYCNGLNSLQRAVQLGQLKAVQLLIHYKAYDIDASFSKFSLGKYAAVQALNVESLTFERYPYMRDVLAQFKNDTTSLKILAQQSSELQPGITYFLQLHTMRLLSNKMKTFAIGGTALHIAVTFSCLNILQCLLENKANLAAQAKNGMTALHLALIFNDIKAMELLLKYASKKVIMLEVTQDINEFIRQGDTVLTITERIKRLPGNYAEMGKMIMTKMNNDVGKTVFFLPQSKKHKQTSPPAQSQNNEKNGQSHCKKMKSSVT